MVKFITLWYTNMFGKVTAILHLYFDSSRQMRRIGKFPIGYFYLRDPSAIRCSHLWRGDNLRCLQGRWFRLDIGLVAPIQNELLSPTGSIIFSYIMVPLTRGYGGLDSNIL